MENIGISNEIPDAIIINKNDFSKSYGLPWGSFCYSVNFNALEKVIKLGDNFVATVKKEYSPGIIGPFSLQSVITKDLEDKISLKERKIKEANKKEEEAKAETAKGGRRGSSAKARKGSVTDAAEAALKESDGKDGSGDEKDLEEDGAGMRVHFKDFEKWYMAFFVLAEEEAADA